MVFHIILSALAVAASIAAVFWIYFSSIKFVEGNFKKFIYWISNAAVLFLAGELISLLSTTTFFPQSLVQDVSLVRSILSLLVGACFVIAAFSLEKLARLYGFKTVEKKFIEAFEQSSHYVKKKEAKRGFSRSKQKPRRRK